MVEGGPVCVGSRCRLCRWKWCRVAADRVGRLAACDIVSGILAASQLAAPLELFNLGNTHPEPVSRLIGLLEEGLGRKANVTTAPITAGDVPLTYVRRREPRQASAGV